MAAFTTIAAATVSIGGSVAKGALAGDAAKTAAREAGRLRLEQEQLEKESVARLEQNFYDAVRATTDVYDKQLERGNVMGAQILEAVQEGDQRGVAAAAGKVKQIQDATLSDTADKFAKQKLDIDMARAEAGERSASEIAALQDDRAAAAGLKADALSAQADQLRGQSTGAFIDAGVAALKTGVSLAGSIQGKAGDKAAESLAESEGISIDEARSQISKYTGKEVRQFNRGDISAIDVSNRSNVTGSVPSPESINTNNTQTIGENIAGVSTAPQNNKNIMTFNGMNVNMSQIMQIAEYEKQRRNQQENKSVYDFNNVLSSFSTIFDANPFKTTK
mgnify:CR=1 FL=1|jgi:hypothetical protein